MKRLLVLPVLLVLFGFLVPIPQARADGFIVVDEPYWWRPPRPPQPIPPPHWPPRPMPPPRTYVFAPLEVSYHHVNVKIDGQIATTSVDQEFYNPNPSRLEGTYLFPIPKGAQLDKFTMDIGGKQVEAELLPADKARRIYEDIVRKAKDPALLEYADRDALKVRIFPIEPHSKKRITLRYTQLLKSDSGLVSYVYPLNTEKFSAKPIKSVSVKVELESKQPLKSIYSPSHSVEIKRHGPNRATVGFETNDAKPDTDFALYFAPENDELGVNLVAHKASGEDGYFLLLVSPGMDAQDKKIVPKDVAFVLDTSGSMAGKKLEQAKKALQFCVENLNDGDHFEIIRFSTEVEPLFDKLVEATKANREKADEFIKDLKPIGGTAIDEALQKALALRSTRDDRSSSLSAPGGRGEGRGEVRATRDEGTAPSDLTPHPDPLPVEGRGKEVGRRSDAAGRPFVVIFLTDGKPTIGTTDEGQIVANAKKQNEGRTRVFCFGIGTDVNTHLLDKITEETRAISQYVLPDEDLEVKVSNFFSKIKEPVLANPALKFTGLRLAEASDVTEGRASKHGGDNRPDPHGHGPAKAGDIRVTKLYPSPLPDLFRGDQLVLVGRYSGRGDSAVVLEGAVNGATRKSTYEVTFPGNSDEHEFIPRLWATRRVGYLLDEIRLHGENSELKDEVTELARKYGIVTPYTAYLIVEDEERRGVPLAMQSLPQLREDQLARREAAQNWDAFKDERGGEKGLAGARYGLALKSANAPAAASAEGMVEASRALGGEAFVQRYGIPGRATTLTATPSADAKERLAQFSQQGQFIAGKNFYQNDTQWVDAAAQKLQNAKKQRLQFNSTEYFAFAAKNPKALPWLALGQNVQFVLGDTLIEVYE